MAWTDDLRPASFRGIPFKVDSSQFTGGRRVSFHEFPDRDAPYPEDLGKVGHTWKLEGYVLGEDYFAQKRALEEELEKEGPGELVHPYYGTLQVQVGAVSIQESKKEGRIATFSMQFYEAGNNNFPKQVDDKQGLLEDSALNGLLKSKDAFDKKFSILDQPGFVVESARKKVAQITDAYMNATKDVRAGTEKIADLAFSIRNLKAEINDLLQAPAKLSQRLLDSLSLLQEALDKPIDREKANSTMYDFGLPAAEVIIATPSRQREKDNNDLLDQFTRETAVNQGVLAASLIEFTSVDEARNKRNNLRDKLEDISLTTTDDEVFQAYRDLNAQLIRTVPDADSQLPNVQEVTLEDTVDSLSLAYDLFENPDAESDLIDRNKIKNPCFILGGSTLEVIDVRKSS